MYIFYSCHAHRMALLYTVDVICSSSIKWPPVNLLTIGFQSCPPVELVSSVQVTHCHLQGGIVYFPWQLMWWGEKEETLPQWDNFWGLRTKAEEDDEWREDAVLREQWNLNPVGVQQHTNSSQLSMKRSWFHRFQQFSFVDFTLIHIHTANINSHS